MADGRPRRDMAVSTIASSLNAQQRRTGTGDVRATGDVRQGDFNNNNTPGDGIKGHATKGGIKSVDVENSVDGEDLLNLIYTVDDPVPWPLAILLGIQHLFTALPSNVIITLALFPALCLSEDDVGRSQLLGTAIFMAGLGTLIQSTLGCRLPIVQGVTVTYLATNLAYLSQPQFASCADIAENMSVQSITNMSLNSSEGLDDRPEWIKRMNELQGAILFGGLTEMVLGFSGSIGFLMRFVSPVAVSSISILISLALVDMTIQTSGDLWWIALATAALTGFCFLVVGQRKTPICQKAEATQLALFPLTRGISVLLGILLMWLLCAILTFTDAFPDDPDAFGYGARTDLHLQLLHKASWFRFPLPLQWGSPSFNPSVILAVVATGVVSAVESVGDYRLCREVSGAPAIPAHAMTRGIFVEGLTSVWSSAWGTGNGLTSYSNNIALIKTTKVGSRRVVQVCGFLLIMVGILGKLTAILATIPTPVVGGILLVLFGMFLAMGIGHLQKADVTSTRNLFVVGFSVFFGVCISRWTSMNEDKITVSVSEIDDALRVLLRMTWFIGGVTAVILDNLLPGTLEERGLVAPSLPPTKDELDTYNLPLLKRILPKMPCPRYLPMCPVFMMKPPAPAVETPDSMNMTRH